MKKYLHFWITCMLCCCFWWGILFPAPWQQPAAAAALTEEETPEIRFFFPEKWAQLRLWWEETVDRSK